MARKLVRKAFTKIQEKNHIKDSVGLHIFLSQGLKDVLFRIQATRTHSDVGHMSDVGPLNRERSHSRANAATPLLVQDAHQQPQDEGHHQGHGVAVDQQAPEELVEPVDL